MNDALVISRLRSVLLAGLPRSSPGTAVPIHGETLHQLCLTEGLLELLDFTRHGSAADPLACMWLASLRWYKLLHGSFPLNAPQPPQQPVDHGLTVLKDAGALHILPGTADASLRGLASGDMGYPSSPAQPQETADAVLIRILPIGLVPYIEDQMRRSWAEQAVALTHGHPDVVETAQQLVTAVHRLAAGEHCDTADLLDRMSSPTAEIVAAQLSAAKTGQLPDPEADLPVSDLLSVVVEDLAGRWETVTAPR